MRHSHNRPLPPLNILMRHSRNSPPTQSPPPLKHLHATLAESTPPSQNLLSFKHPYAMVGHSGIQTFLAKNMLPFLTSIREALGIYSSLPEYTMWFSQNLPLSPAWISVHAPEGAYIRAYISYLGTQCVQCIRTVTVPPTRGCSISGSRMWRKGRAHRVFWVHFRQFRGFFKEFGENRGLLPMSILDFTDLCADRGLEVGLADLLCHSGGGGGASAPNAPPPA